MPKKILLAEDSLTIQKVFELTFAQGDFALTMVDNGTDAVRLAAELLPDLVVADVTLPGRDGFEVAGDLRAAGATRNCPVLILSGSLGPFDEDRFKACGARGVLFKPFESQELIDKVNEVLSAAENAVADVKSGAPAHGTEEWDFSDVLEEIDDGHGVIPAARRDAAAAPAGGEAISLEEFDVPVEEAAAPAPAVPAPPEPPAAAPAEPEEAPFSPEAPCEEDVSAITDLSPALADVEELEEISDLEEMELLHKEPAAPPPSSPPEPAPAVAPASTLPPPPGEDVDLNAFLADETAVCVPAAGLPALEPAGASAPEPRPAPGEDLEAIVGEVPAAPVAPPGFPEADALREQFSARAREVVEQVVAESVEKAVWEWMDRLTAEFSERIRESVESVAWDVIPKTAETLIREEIARIRRMEGKQGGSR